MNTEFHSYIASLAEGDRALVDALFASLASRLSLPKYYADAITRDYERALLAYRDAGVPVSEAASRLDPTALGGYYARPSKAWYPLDSSAKVYPLSMARSKMAVFRLSAYLKEDVEPALLQIALNETITRFPYFAVCVRKGFFWHYLDSLKRRFDVEAEMGPPCQVMNVATSRSPAFRVLYYKNRVSVEFFHLLTDGTGGMIFLKSLTAAYLRLLGAEIPAEEGVLDTATIPSSGESSNDFDTFYKKGKSGGFIDTPAVQMGGELSKVKPCRVLHFDMDAGQLVEAAHRRGVSVTTLVTAAIFVATRSAMDTAEGTIKVQVPVNMRKLHPSVTLRNFALYTSVRLPAGEVTDLGSILPAVTEQLRTGTGREAMEEMLNGAVMLVKSLRFIPLLIKSPVARLIYGYLGDSVFSNTLSNLGVVKVPDAMTPYIEKFDFVLGTVYTNRAACSMVTFSNHAVLSIAKLTADPAFEEALLRELGKLGLTADVSGSIQYGS